MNGLGHRCQGGPFEGRNREQIPLDLLPGTVFMRQIGKGSDSNTTSFDKRFFWATMSTISINLVENFAERLYETFYKRAL